MEKIINIAVIGGTGVGKSTFINYLLPGLKDKAPTGAGKPVTEKGFNLYKEKVENENGAVNVHCYDSWGLEVDKFNEWMGDLKDVLKKRGPDKSPSEWFHSIFYLIDASGSRVQDNDKNLINLLRDKKCRVNVIFTKSDLVSEEDSKSMRNVLKEEFGDTISIADICSEGKKTRSGCSDPFGKEDVIKMMSRDFMMIMVDRMPIRFEAGMDAEIKKLGSAVIDKIEGDISWLTADEDSTNIKRWLESKLIPDLRDKLIIHVGRFNSELVELLENIEVFIEVCSIASTLDLRSFNKEYKTLYNGLFGDDPEVCIDASDYVWNAGKFISKMIPLITVIDLANNFLNRGDRQRESLLKSWISIERSARKIVKDISEDMKIKLQSVVDEI